MGDWTLLTNHARALLSIAHDPGIRLRDLALDIGVTERTAYGIVADLSDAGYVVKERDGRRNRYQIQEDLPLAEGVTAELTIGEVLDLLVDVRRRTLPGGGQSLTLAGDQVTMIVMIASLISSVIVNDPGVGNVNRAWHHPRLRRWWSWRLRLLILPPQSQPQPSHRAT